MSKGADKYSEGDVFIRTYRPIKGVQGGGTVIGKVTDKAIAGHMVTVFYDTIKTIGEIGLDRSVRRRDEAGRYYFHIGGGFESKIIIGERKIIKSIFGEQDEG